ncbi:ATP-dependent nuclease [Bacteroides uniformis]|uniref:ATP-dependent nuclease n=1 Tax=Bacteroides uniformis TaxID=820 RepID=UPI0021D3F19C|nr:AAA family ATPase [Bacteroides uniformis]
MSRIHSLQIENFRGIKNFNQVFHMKPFICLIGRGDSGKTTILKAISYVLCPNWNISISDLDFYEADITKKIIIEAVVGDLPNELTSIQKYGQYINLLDGDKVTSEIDDPNADQEKIVLRIRLTIDSTLEPKWEVCSGRDIGDIAIPASDRAKLNMFMVSDYIDNHFAYSKGSPLYALLRQELKDKTVIDKKMIEVVRNSYEAIKEAKTFKEFDDVTLNVKKAAQNIGLTITNLETMLEYKDNAYTESNITLHSNDIPYRLQGKGSKRLLSMAIQKGLVFDGGIMLIDEIEQGLESDRARNLARLLSKNEKAQIFITTHSQDVIKEPEISSVYLMRKGENKLCKYPEILQGTIRSQPAAFFAKRVISCEGATEEGIIRAINDHLQEERGYGLAVQGIVHIDGSGSNQFYNYAQIFNSMGYDSLVFCDDDNRAVDKDKEEAINNRIKVVLCDNGKAIEQQLFNDLPWEAICELLDYAIQEHGEQKIIVSNGFGSVEEIKNATEEMQIIWREKLGEKAKSKQAWFKNIHHGEQLGRTLIKYLSQMDAECTLKKEYEEILKWIGNDIN